METLLVYSTDLTDAQWLLIEAELPPQKTSGRTGRPRKYGLRAIFNAIFYQLRTGCQWRLLPKDLPPWNLVWVYFCRFRDDGTLERIHAALRKQVRKQAGKRATPTAVILDSQSVKTTEKGGRAAMMAARKSRVASAISW